MSIPFWINKPSILIEPKYIFDLWPQEKMSYNQKLNTISRVVILLTILGSMVFMSLRLFFTGIITLGVIIFLHYIQEKENKKEKESFVSMDFMKKNYLPPAPINPLMNVQLTDYKDDPERKPAAPSFNPIVEENINQSTKKFVVSSFEPQNKTEEECIKSRLFQDLGDNFVFNQSMRNFYSTPNTTIPNDQKAFADFCYGDMISCKEGNPIACAQWEPRLGSVPGG